MKITILQGAFLPVPPKLGGAVEKMWFALGKDFAKKGHSVVHVSRRYADLAGEEWIDGVLHKRVRGYQTPSSGIRLKYLDLLYTLRARKMIPADSDVIVTNTFWAPLVLAKKLKCRCMVDVQRMPKGQMKWYKHVSRLRANSTPVTEAIKRELSINTHPKVKMIPNPLPFHKNSLSSNSGKAKVVLYVGRIHPEKGLDILLHAFNNIGADWRLKIVGPWEISAGGGGSEYLESLKKISCHENVEFKRPVFDMNILNEYYKEAAIFVYPSVAEHGETFGLAPLEAMAWGSVPIVSNLSCFQDFIKDGYNGLIFDHRAPNRISLLEKAIEILQQDQSYRSKLAEKALGVLNSHSCLSIASVFLEEFTKMTMEMKYNPLAV